MKSLLDTGPLVAIISKDDAEHIACAQTFSLLDRPPVTCWPVITEAAYLLRHNLEHVETLLDFATEGIISIADIDIATFSSWLHKFFSSYKDQRPQIADAALVFLAEQLEIDTIFTLDRRDFSIYRTLAGKPLIMIP